MYSWTAFFHYSSFEKYEDDDDWILSWGRFVDTTTTTTTTTTTIQRQQHQPHLEAIETKTALLLHSQRRRH